ncbi:MAG: 50S ribosomal protein L9 [Thermodesulfobacteriota bacterium]
MQVILQTDIENLGKLGELVKVKPGYARNYLIPKKLALEATPGNLKSFEQQKKKLQEKLDAEKFAAQDLSQKIEQLEVKIPVRVGESDKLYGSVTNSHIAQALAEEGYEIDKKNIELDKPIRSLGEFYVPVKVYPEIKPQVKVVVVRHGEEEQQGEEEPEQE